MTEPKSHPKGQIRTARMSPEERKKTLLEKAIGYFSEEGFDGGTRGLARQMGITQPLIYRYFPSKEDLINEVYRAVYVSRWKDEWVEILRDRKRPLRDRLIDFYATYTDTVFRRVWMRIFFFSGLRGLDINKRYMQRVVDNLLIPICEELRTHLGITSAAPITDHELDLVLMMHGAIFYQGIRSHIYQIARATDPARDSRIAIEMLLCVAPREVAAALATDPVQPIISGPRAPLQ